MNRNEFEKRICSNRDHLLSIARTKLSPSEAEDAVQNAILSAWIHLPQLRSEAAFDAWIKRILINECHLMFRNKQREKETVIRLIDTTEADSPDKLPIYDALEEMDVHDRELLLKHHELGYSIGELALERRITEDAVKMRLYGDWNAVAAADISEDVAAAQAIDIALRYFEALGVDIDPVPYAISRPYDYNDYIERQTEYYHHCFSDAAIFIENAKADWKRREEYLPEQCEYTTLSFYILLEGMRLASFTDYPAGFKDEHDAWIGISVSADITVSDSGNIVEAICPLLEIKKRRPIEGEQTYVDFLQHLKGKSHKTIIQADSWQHALSSFLSNMQVRPYQENRPYQNKSMIKPIIQYGSRCVVTGIHPVLHTISQNEWAPFWTIEIKDEFDDGWRL